ncbi:hypothetical protein LMG31506_02351 [Cupriavidus yeoncheonensis]|uniref:Uncharacterized protein n=1 Tax=Cupriavidus yeoncheonensis TaxID=1462994 RepID=A0A916ITB4_9BURK|nr:hypothetical protein [Cupriavidus yeoncheonensis]CAG2140592.1 hypothetical protein LMG31506_02351 [Cupriavidus yeoncheonensis]
MNASRYLLIVITAIAAAISAAPVLAKSGNFDPHTDGARTEKYSAYTDGAKNGGKYDIYSDGARYIFSSDQMPH